MKRQFLTILTVSSAAMVLAACDGLNINTARGREREQEEKRNQDLIQVSPEHLRPELDRDLDGVELLAPGMVRPSQSGPLDTVQIERDLFADMPSDGVSPGRHGLEISTLELMVLEHTGANKSPAGIRQYMSFAPGQAGPSAPLNYNAELSVLAAQGIAVSPK